MAQKVSIKAAVRDAQRAEVKFLKGSGKTVDGVPTLDSFVNFAHKLGIGADNALSTASYSFNPITRNRTLLEWIHRGSWLGGVAVDCVADDMTRAGVDFTTELPPDASLKIDAAVKRLNIWPTLNETIKWGRLYGGAVAVMLVDGQDFRTPLDIGRVGPNDFRGIIALDRWMLEPQLNDLVTDMGPNLGLPRYYRVTNNAPALRGVAVHFSRLACRIEGIKLPYQQRLAEMLWGISVLERLYDRMIAFDTASTGAAQLVGKAYLRTLKIDGMREVVAAGGSAQQGLIAYTELMRRYQGIEGITMIDAKDEFNADAHGAFSGLDSVLTQFASQLSGALQIPLTRLFGQSPGGLNATGESDMRNYYDSIRQRQMNDLDLGVTRIYKAIAASEEIALPPDFGVAFEPLWQLTETDKGSIAKTTTETILSAKEAGLISDRTALQELRQQSRTTGVFSKITAQQIVSASDEIEPPEPEMPPGMDPSDPMAGNEDAQPGGGKDDTEPEGAGSKGAAEALVDSGTFSRDSVSDQPPVRRKERLRAGQGAGN